MLRIKSGKIFLVLAVLLFVAKPFIGFTVFNRTHQPATENILVKAFTKRKLEDTETNKSNINSILKNLANPVIPFTVLFSFFLALIFPAVLASGADITNRFLRLLKLRPFPGEPAYLLNGKLTI